MITLRDLQDRFQRAILDRDDAILEDIRDTSKENRNVLLGVYRHAYSARLVEVLQSEYPILHVYLGDDAFEDLGRRYIAQNPSRFRNARWFGSALPDFLAEPGESLVHPELRDLALIERALSDAFDAADAACVTLADLLAFEPASFPGLVFSPHPSVRRLTLHTNALALWSALKDEGVPPPADRETDPVHLLAWRQESTSRIRPLAADEAMMWDEAAKGVRFGVLCEMLAMHSEPESADARAAGFLKGWIDSGALGAVTAS